MRRHRPVAGKVAELGQQRRLDGLGNAAGVGQRVRAIERDAAACHRSLIAARLARETGAKIVNLRP